MTIQPLGQPPIYLHWNPERTDYSVTPEELRQLCREGENLWKDVCLVTTSLGVPCAINAIAEASQRTAFTLTLVLFLNSLVGIVCFALAIIFGIAWFRSRKDRHNLITTIMNKPKVQLFPQVMDVGPLPGAIVAQTRPAQQTQDRSHSTESPPKGAESQP